MTPRDYAELTIIAGFIVFSFIIDKKKSIHTDNIVLKLLKEKITWMYLVYILVLILITHFLNQNIFSLVLFFIIPSLFYFAKITLTLSQYKEKMKRQFEGVVLVTGIFWNSISFSYFIELGLLFWIGILWIFMEVAKNRPELSQQKTIINILGFFFLISNILIIKYGYSGISLSLLKAYIFNLIIIFITYGYGYLINIASRLNEMDGWRKEDKLTAKEKWMLVKKSKLNINRIQQFRQSNYFTDKGVTNRVSKFFNQEDNHYSSNL